MYHYLMYVSYAAKTLSDKDLEKLLTSSREKNESLDITGMLLYIDGKFIQVLEGEKDAINELYSTIVADPRHKKVNKIIEGKTVTRNFPEWNMGFKSISGKDYHNIPGFNNIEDYFKSHAVDESSHVTLIFLRLFYNKYFNKETSLINRQ
jgi:hypothetical protein